MFGWFKKDPVAAARKAYEAKQAEAQRLQRSGDIPAFALASAEAEALLEEVERLERARDGSGER